MLTVAQLLELRAFAKREVFKKDAPMTQRHTASTRECIHAIPACGQSPMTQEQAIAG
ncbi:hypothetical protein [Albidovulum sediminis]|uniref:Transposase n=1 Tax=Albidovulum sediminis TaxID=3066345 RepID=A0ABT2NN38_9RHOB|nr:hypothetical protein [Defluviimonas sediminis]MCT8329369.1 hypothetical protein [Defluviimonas sediminis]